MLKIFAMFVWKKLLFQLKGSKLNFFFCIGLRHFKISQLFFIEVYKLKIREKSFKYISCFVMQYFKFLTNRTPSGLFPFVINDLTLFSKCMYLIQLYFIPHNQWQWPSQSRSLIFLLIFILFIIINVCKKIMFK